ncbi:hemicentin-2-like [Aricia agestis]|uniref:hemicentin-2-like n=1 Tax=Aricia agestis TaxID=91739 RepID=UPI001C206C35|nr:hemicentin-2-like [Aricia agestis]
MSVCTLLMFCVLPALVGGRASIDSEGTAFARQPGAVMARVGDPVVLNCRILRLGDRVVSWVRSRDLQILTHAGAVFTADARVTVTEAPWETDDGLDPEEWGGVVHLLRIDKVRLSDAGRYECQVNTEPKLSAFFNLTVIEDALPTVSVRMLGATAAAVEGGAVRLTCEARYDGAAAAVDALPALRVSWDRDGEVLDPQGSRGGVSLDTERWPGRTVSRLTLARVSSGDAGRYTCRVADVTASRDVRVTPMQPEYSDIDEELLESMQRDQAAARTGAAARSMPPAALLSALTALAAVFLT